MTTPSLTAMPGAETRRRDARLSMLPVSLPSQVMLVKNLAVSRGLVNGARGVVVGFEAEGRGKWWGSRRQTVQQDLPCQGGRKLEWRPCWVVEGAEGQAGVKFQKPKSLLDT